MTWKLAEIKKEVETTLAQGGTVVMTASNSFASIDLPIFSSHRAIKHHHIAVSGLQGLGIQPAGT